MVENCRHCPALVLLLRVAGECEGATDGSLARFRGFEVATSLGIQDSDEHEVATRSGCQTVGTPVLLPTHFVLWRHDAETRRRAAVPHPAVQPFSFQEVSRGVCLRCPLAVARPLGVALAVWFPRLQELGPSLSHASLPTDAQHSHTA